MKIIYKTNNGVSIVTPTQEALEFMNIKEIAIKDVPNGVEFWLINDDEIPSDREFRNAWVWETDKDSDGKGGAK